MLSILHLFAMEWRSYPMFVLLLPLVAAILFFNRFYRDAPDRGTGLRIYRAERSDAYGEMRTF